MALSEDRLPLGKSEVRRAVQRFEAIAGSNAGSTGGGCQIATLDLAGIGVEAKGDINTLVPVDAGIPEVDDARNPVAEAGDDPEREQKAQQVGRQGLLPMATFHPWGHGRAFSLQESWPKLDGAWDPGCGSCTSLCLVRSWEE